MNKQSNTYTLIYIIVLVALVGTGLAFTSMSLRGRQQQNIAAEKMRQILASVHIVPDKGQVISDFDKYITEQYIVDAAGNRVEGDAFDVDVAKQVALPAAERRMPVFECTLADGSRKYILAAYGAGLWGPIWGYVSVDADASTVYGAYFGHQGETPGLGAEIEKPAFSDQFQGKQMFKDGRFLPVEVVKAGQKPAGDNDYVDGISGGTVTSKGVSAMLDNCLTSYSEYLNKIRS